LFKASDAVIAMTSESAAELQSIGYSPTRVLKVPNGVTLLSATSPQRDVARAVEVVYVGRLSAEKGLPDLLRAWADIRHRVTRPVVLRLIGDGPLAADLRAQARALGVDDVVDFFGFTSNVPAELAKAQLFVLASPAEGNSNAILEAMSAGLPVVATRVGGAVNQVGREGERFLVRPGDAKALADALLELIEDDALRCRLGAAMRARVQQVFDINHIAAVYERAYQLIARGECDQVGAIDAGA
jgi:glycosyltransferase involved in cell wall biosynthesis